MNAPRVFDYAHYELLNRARGEIVSHLLEELAPALNLRTAIDVGCGAGYFSNLLRTLGLQVMGVDGRQQNVEESQRRNPEIRFVRCDAEDPTIRSLGEFDLVFCFGLLYHLENPLLAIRHLHHMTEKLLLVESVTFPGTEPVMALIDESLNDDQGLNHIAFYPTEACLVKMMYRAGFSSVYGFAAQPDHPEYVEGPGRLRIRTMLVASNSPIHCDQLVVAPEPSSQIRPWDPKSGAPEDDAGRKLKRFAKKPLNEKVKSIKRIIRMK